MCARVGAASSCLWMVRVRVTVLYVHVRARVGVSKRLSGDGEG